MRKAQKKSSDLFVFLFLTSIIVCVWGFNIMPIVDIFQKGLNYWTAISAIAKWFISPFVMLICYFLAIKGDSAT